MASETQSTQPRQDVELQTKQELESAGEPTVPGKRYVPPTDIYETSESLILAMEMPGVDKDDVVISLDKDVLSIEGRIDVTQYGEIRPLYTEYNIGNFARRFTLSRNVDRGNIQATVADGVLTIELGKAEEAKARRIPVK